MNQLPFEIKQAVQNELKRGEVVKWEGQPIPIWKMFTAFALYLFFIPWTAFSVFWIHGAIQQEEPGSMYPLFGVPFLLIGICMLLSPFWEYFKAKKTAYVITNIRAFTLEKVRDIKVKNFYPDNIGNLEKKVRADGSGDLILEVERYKDSDGDDQSKERGFFAVANVNDVEHIIDALVESHA